MNEQILVGLIIGLVITSSLYVIQSNKFTETQRILLLICVIIPPLQWFLILLCLLNNKNETQFKNSKQDLTQNQNILTELRNKGILSEEEYSEKTKEIQKQKIEAYLLNSIEYKQLKSLLDTGILSKEEFEDKVIKLKAIIK